MCSDVWISVEQEKSETNKTKIKDKLTKSLELVLSEIDNHIQFINLRKHEVVHFLTLGSIVALLVLVWIVAVVVIVIVVLIACRIGD